MFNFARTLVLAPVLAAGIAIAATLPAAAAQAPFNSAGAINANGTVAFGSGFTVAHTGPGQYLVTFPTSTGFTSMPAVVVTPWGVDGHVVTPVLSSIGGQNGGVQFTIQMSDKVNKLKFEDNGFMFLLIES